MKSKHTYGTLISESDSGYFFMISEVAVECTTTAANDRLFFFSLFFFSLLLASGEISSEEEPLSFRFKTDLEVGAGVGVKNGNPGNPPGVCWLITAIIFMNMVAKSLACRDTKSI